MMATEMIKEFLVGLGFKVDEGGQNRFMGAIQGMTDKVIGFGNTLLATPVGQFAVATAGVATVVAGAAALVAHEMDGIAKGFNSLDLLGTRLKMTASDIDDFIDSAELLGVSGDIAEQSLIGLTNAIGESAIGIGRATAIFKDLGISVTDATGKTKATGVVLEELKTKMQGLDKSTQFRVMERLGLDPALLRVFASDAKSILDELGKIDQATGFDFDTAVQSSKQYVQAQRQMNTEMGLMGKVVDTAKESLIAELLPYAIDGIKGITQALRDIRPIVLEALPPLMDGIKALMPWLVQAVVIFIQMALFVGKLTMAFMPFVVYCFKVAAVVGTVIGVMKLWALAQAALNLVMSMNPIGLVIIGITALIASIVLLTQHWNTVTTAAKNAWAAMTGGKMQPMPKVGTTIPSTATPPIGVTRAGTASRGAGGNATLNQQTSINVYGSGNPQATADAVNRQHHKTTANAVRNLKPIAR